MEQARRRVAIGGIAGIGAGVLWNLGQAGYDGGPRVGNSSASEIARFYAEDATTARIGTVVGGIVFLLFLLFMAGLRARLVESGTGQEAVWFISASGLTLGIFYLLAISAAAAPLVRPLENYDEAFVTSMHALRALGEQFVFNMVPRVLLIAGVSAAVLRHRVLPRWVAFFGMVVAALAALGALRFLFSPAGGTFGLFDGLSILSNFTLPLWIIVTGAAMLRPLPRAATTG